jgi:hypothetical protein
MTTATDADTELAAKRAEWLDALGSLVGFFGAHPEMIDGTIVRVTRWVHDDHGTAREEVIRFVELTGPCTVIEMSAGSSYVEVRSDTFAPHVVTVCAEKAAAGHRVECARPEVWQYDAVEAQS